MSTTRSSSAHSSSAKLAHERRRGRATYTELEESDADLARHKRWLESIRARDYFGAPGRDEAADAVDACERALAAFEEEALASELSKASGEDVAEPTGKLRLLKDP